MLLKRSGVPARPAAVFVACAVVGVFTARFGFGSTPSAQVDDPADRTAWVLEPRNPRTPELPNLGTQELRTKEPRNPGTPELWFSVANRNLNPLNLKFGSKTRRYVDIGLATLSDIIPTDGGRFLRFDDPETGFRAAADLLNAYGDLELDGALRKWSNTGYGGAILAGTRLDQKTSIADLRRGDFRILLHAMAAAEGYRSATIGDEIRKALQ